MKNSVAPRPPPHQMARPTIMRHKLQRLSCSCRIAIQSLVMALIFRDKGTSGTQIDVLNGDLRIAHVGKEVLRIVASHAVR